MCCSCHSDHESQRRSRSRVSQYYARSLVSKDSREEIASRRRGTRRSLWFGGYQDVSAVVGSRLPNPGVWRLKWWFTVERSRAWCCSQEDCPVKGGKLFSRRDQNSCSPEQKLLLYSLRKDLQWWNSQTTQLRRAKLQSLSSQEQELSQFCRV